MDNVPFTDNLGRTMNVSDDHKHQTPDETREWYTTNSDDNIVCCLNLGHELNIGNIIRTSSLFGVGKVIVLGKRQYNKRGTVGQHKYIPIDKICCTTGTYNDSYDLDKIIDILTGYSETHVIVFAEQGGINLANSFDNVDKPVLFVFGNETNGVPVEIMKGVKDCVVVSIPQKGVGRSHSVGCAAAMVLWEYYRTRM